MQRLILILLMLMFTGLAAPASHAQAPVSVTGGMVAGVQLPNSPVRVYKGIPFAAPPVGDLRWHPPQPVIPWQGTRYAYDFSDACIQVLTRSRLPWSKEFMHLSDASEDCLYLNVWTAAESPAEKRPVMVYIYGGGLQEGSSAIAVYDGEEFAKKGVVLVGINYRVGALGFMAHPELTKASRHQASGNYGFLDQLAALQWVQENIEAFGGDPNNVTIFGQSAGARSVAMHVKSPLSKGLFQRAIIHSGAQRREPVPASNLTSLAEAEQRGLTAQERIGVNNLAALRRVPAERFIQPDIPRMGAITDGWFMPAEVDNTSEVPIMIGFVADDGFVSATSALTEADYKEEATSTYQQQAAHFLSLYPPESYTDPKVLKLAAMRDKAQISIQMWAANQAEKSETIYTYYFNRAIPWPEHPEFGAFHTGEIPYVFNNLKMIDRPWEDVDYRVADQVSSYWVNFATTGDPNGSGLAHWPAFDADAGQTMRLGKNMGAIPVPAGQRASFWETYFEARLN